MFEKYNFKDLKPLKIIKTNVNQQLRNQLFAINQKTAAFYHYKHKKHMKNYKTHLTNNGEVKNMKKFVKSRESIINSSKKAKNYDNQITKLDTKNSLGKNK